MLVAISRYYFQIRATLYNLTRPALEGPMTTTLRGAVAATHLRQTRMIWEASRPASTKLSKTLRAFRRLFKSSNNASRTHTVFNRKSWNRSGSPKWRPRHSLTPLVRPFNWLMPLQIRGDSSHILAPSLLCLINTLVGLVPLFMDNLRDSSKWPFPWPKILWAVSWARVSDLIC